MGSSPSSGRSASVTRDLDNNFNNGGKMRIISAFMGWLILAGIVVMSLGVR